MLEPHRKSIPLLALHPLELVETSRRILLNICKFQPASEAQAIFFSQCLTNIIIVCLRHSTKWSTPTVIALAQKCAGPDELLAVLLEVETEDEMILALENSNCTVEDISALIHKVQLWLAQLEPVTVASEIVLSRVSIVYALHHSVSNKKLFSEALQTRLRTLLASSSHSSAKLLSLASPVLSKKVIQFYCRAVSPSVVAHAFKKRLHLGFPLQAGLLLQAGCGVLYPLDDFGEYGADPEFVHSFMNDRLFSGVPNQGAGAPNPLEQDHTLVDRLCYEMNFEFAEPVAEMILFCAQHKPTLTAFDTRAWNHLVACSLIRTNQVQSPPAWLVEFSVVDHLLVHLLVDAAFYQAKPCMIPYNFAVQSGLKCKWIPTSLWTRSRKLAPLSQLDDQDVFLIQCISEVLTSPVVDEHWAQGGPLYEYFRPIPRPDTWRESNILFESANSGHLHFVRRFLGLGASVSRKTKTFGKTALWAACANNDLAIARVLLQRGADPSEQGEIYVDEHYSRVAVSCMEIAQTRGHVEIVDLIRNGDPGVPSFGGVFGADDD